MQNKRGEIQRDLYHSMLSWKNNPQRLVLLLRGARQVGKTYFIEQFAKQHFEECVNINLDIFLNEKNISLGVRISELMPSIESRVLSLPFYLVSELSRLYRSELDRCHDVH